MEGYEMNKCRTIYYYKENGENFPVMISETDGLPELFLSERSLMKIIKQSPEAKGSLYALTDGTEFKLKESIKEPVNEKVEIDVLVSDEEIEKVQKVIELLKEAKTLVDELAVNIKFS